MKRHFSTFGLDPEKMSELLRIAGDEHDYEKALTDEQAKAEMLADRLSEPLLLDSSFSRLLPTIPGLLSSVIDIDGNEPIGRMLQNPDAELSLLIKVKDYFNRLSKNPDSKTECAVSIALYYGAIASALIFHNNKITRFSYEDLDKALNSLINKTWIPEELISLYNRARKICRTTFKEQD